tara:strand:- start:164 stop:493 length:330 start_codon:yes stop_codon:yes gene_type:complete
MKYLYFQDGNNDAYCYPVSRFIGFRHAADTTLVLNFLPQNNELNTTAGGIKDIATLTIVSGTEKDVIKAIVSAINAPANNDGGIIVVADNLNQEYLSPNITDLAGTIDT